MTKTQKAHPSGWAFHLFDAWQFPTLTWGDPTLPSALRRFTSEFGMGVRWDHRASAARQILCAQYAILYRISRVARARKVSHIPQYAPSFPSLVALLLRKLLRTQL